MNPIFEVSLALALLGFAFQGFSDFLLKCGVDQEGDPFSIIAMTVPTFFTLSAFSGLLLGELEFRTATIGFGVMAGTLSLVALNLFVISLKEGEVSVTSTLFRLNFVVASLLAIFILDESATWSKWVGLTLAAGAIYSISWGGHPHRKGMARATALAVAALLTYGINSFFFKIATLYEVSVPAYTVATSLTFGALSVAAHFSPWKAVRLRVNRVVLRYGLISGFIIGVAFNTHDLVAASWRRGKRCHPHLSTQFRLDRRLGHHPAERAHDAPKRDRLRLGHWGHYRPGAVKGLP